MSGGRQRASPGDSRGLALVGVAAAWAMYAPYFFLPASGPLAFGAPPDLPMKGWEVFQVAWVSPVLWLLLIGHFLFWCASVLLAFRRWGSAAAGGFLALGVSLTATALVGRIYSGVWCQLLAAAVVGLVGLAGRARGRR